jgi:hypothetical protein
VIEPISLGAIGAYALTEGIKFLYTQAGELLRHWRERRDGAQQERTGPQLRPPAEIIEGNLESVPPDLERVDRLESDLREQWRSVAGYAAGVEAVDPADMALLDQVDALRQSLEVVYGQRITFKGEAREPSRPLVKNEVLAMEAEIIASRVGNVSSGGASVENRVDATRAKISGSSVGNVDVGAAPREEDQP